MRTNVQGKRFPIKGLALTTAVQPFEQNSRGKLEEGLNRFHVKGGLSHLTNADFA